MRRKYRIWVTVQWLTHEEACDTCGVEFLDQWAFEDTNIYPLSTDENGGDPPDTDPLWAMSCHCDHDLHDDTSMEEFCRGLAHHVWAMTGRWVPVLIQWCRIAPVDTLSFDHADFDAFATEVHSDLFPSRAEAVDALVQSSLILPSDGSPSGSA
jgi:hypothetical protein